MRPGVPKHGEEVIGAGKAMSATAVPALPRGLLMVGVGCPDFAALNPGYV
jgi:hypothetical protein